MLKSSLVACAVLILSLIGFSGSGASAYPVMSPPALSGALASPLMLQVRHGGGGHGGYYRGPRYRGYNGYHGYNGYIGNRYYPRRFYGYNNYYRPRCYGWDGYNCLPYGGIYAPFWGLGTGVVITTGRARYGSRHVQWCLNRYRSYQPRSNTWVAYSGRVRQCISPYGP